MIFVTSCCPSLAAVIVLPKRSQEVDDPSCVLNNKQLQSIGIFCNVYMAMCLLMLVA